MKLAAVPTALRGPRASGIALGLVLFAGSAALFSRYGIGLALGRDEAVYAYGGEQLAHGVPVYVSIFDPKAPMATFVAGIGALGGRMVGGSELDGVRIAYLVASCLTVVAMYVLGTRLWGSRAAGVVAAVAFASFRGFALDALAGPDAKTPGILFVVVALWLGLERRWLLTGVAAALAVLTWQPLAGQLLVAVLAAGLLSDAARRRSAVLRVVAGAAVTAFVALAWMALAGALTDFWQAAVSFPLAGIYRGPDDTTAGNIARFWHALVHYYGYYDVVLWLGGTFALLALAAARVGRQPRAAWRDPLLCLVLLGFVLIAVYSAFDFQGYPDVYPLLPYPPLGLAGAAAALMRHRPGVLGRAVVPLLTVVVLAATSFTWWRYSRDGSAEATLRNEQGEACAVDTLLGPRGTLIALGDPTPLVLTGRRDPDRFIYLNSGVADWHAHRLGGLDGWLRQLQSFHPDVIAVKFWTGDLRMPMGVRLATRYERAYAGTVRVFYTPAAAARAAAAGVKLTPHPTPVATDTAGRPLGGCASGRASPARGQR